MTQAQEWVTYERFGGRLEKQQVTLPAGTKRPLGFSSERPATKDEIATEKKRLANKKRYQERVEKFMARTEYQDAQMIASTLELMDVDRNPLDRYTPDEWREMRERICGADKAE